MTTSRPEYMRIRQYVLNRVYKAKELEKLPSERAICDMFAVSRKTVRRAVQDLTEEGVIIPKARRGYFIKPASEPITGNSIGLIFGNGMNISYDRHHLRMLSSITTSLATKLARVQFLNFSSKDHIAEEISRLSLDGIIWIIHSELFPLMEKIELPIMPISFSGTPASGNAIINNISNGTTVAYDHLIKKGHQNILFVGASADSGGMTGAIESLKQHKLPVHQDLFFKSSKDIEKKIKSILRTKPLPFSAVFCRSVHCEVFCSIAAEQGISIPSDLDFITEDDHISLTFNPGLTRIRRPLEEMGRVATEKLIDIIEDKIKAPYRQEFEWELVN